MIHPYDPQAAMNAKYAAFARKDAATARRLGPSAWRDDWMPATKETLMDAPEPWRPDAIDDVIANWLAMSDYAHARDAYTAAQNLREVLGRKGYTITPRASQAATAPRTPGDDAGAAHEADKPAAGRTGLDAEVVRDVVIPTIREQAFATARAEIAKLRDDQTFDDELSATARVAYTVALNWIDRIARGDQ